MEGGAGGINSHGTSIAIRAVLEDNGLVDETIVDQRLRSLNPFIPTGDAALRIVLLYMRDAEKYSVDHREPAGYKVKEATKPRILDPYTDKNYYENHYKNYKVEEMRKEIADFYLEHLTPNNWDYCITRVKRAMEAYKSLTKAQKERYGFRMDL